MIRRLSRSLLAVTLILSNVAIAEHPELLIPVIGEEEQRVLAANQYFIKKGSYFAKRYRIVRVDTDLLLGSDEALTISLFDDVSIPVVRKEISVRNGGVNFTWRGRYASVPFTPDELASFNPGMSLEHAERLYDSLFEIRIGGTQYVFDKDPANAEGVAGMRQDPETGRLIYETERLAQKLKEGTIVYGVSLNLLPLIPESIRQGQKPLSVEYQIRSLPMDRRYSAVYELDPDKRLPMGDGNYNPTPKQAEKLRQYKEFLESLGDDPRDAVHRNDPQQ